MKIQYVVFLLTFTTSLFSQTTEEVRELTTLRDSWTRAREQALKPIDLKYEASLRVLMEKLMKSGDLKGALQVDTELKSIAKSTDTTPSKALTNALGKTPPVSEIQLIAGTSWESRVGSQVEFDAKGKFVEKYKGKDHPGTWKISSDPDTFEVIMDAGTPWRFTLDTDKQILTRSGGLIYTRIKKQEKNYVE